MANDAKAAVQDADQGGAPKRNKKLLIIILALLLLVVLGGSAAILLMRSSDDHADDEEAAEAAALAKKKKDKKAQAPLPVFVNLEPFTVNLVPENGDQYLQVSLSLEFQEASAEQDVKIHMPKIRNNVTLLLSSKKASELVHKEGKQALADELSSVINDVLDPPKKNKKGEVIRTDDGPVKDVLFTSFIIQ